MARLQSDSTYLLWYSISFKCFNDANRLFSYCELPVGFNAWRRWASDFRCLSGLLIQLVHCTVFHVSCSVVTAETVEVWERFVRLEKIEQQSIAGSRYSDVDFGNALHFLGFATYFDTGAQLYADHRNTVFWPYLQSGRSICWDLSHTL